MRPQKRGGGGRRFYVKGEERGIDVNPIPNGGEETVRRDGKREKPPSMVTQKRKGEMFGWVRRGKRLLPLLLSKGPQESKKGGPWQESVQRKRGGKRQ